MRYYTLREELSAGSRWTGGYDLGRPWQLPGVECPTCGATWGGGGYDYPTVDLSALAGSKDYARPRCVPWAEFTSLRERVLPLLPPGATVGPGSGFGPLTGRARGRFAPVVVHMPWLLLMHPDVMAKLEGLTGAVPVPTRFKGARSVELVELEVLPGGRIVGAEAHEPCGTCGRTTFARPPLGKLRVTALPDVDFARPSASLVVCSERVIERLAPELSESEVVAVDVGAPEEGTTARPG
ncbi:double-CXXCG motif protein [Myxococcus faecalis]|uniref:SitI6 family double-CXXCG motif immunity protein n=1 Tax=Myxococcus faecalis TaxID=3115646 RepID=UPI0024C71FB2|nr:double-CXXCG motif protein [Myxococcus sp. MH1]